MSRDPARRAVVTGLGAITPIGNDAATFWASLLAGTSGVAPISAYDASAEEVRIAAEVKGFDPADLDGLQAGPPHEPLLAVRGGGRGAGDRRRGARDHRRQPRRDRR